MEILDLEKKKVDLCIEFMKLGMDFDSACVASEIGEELKEKLNASGGGRDNITVAVLKQ